jgi:hypothetical protein
MNSEPTLCHAAAFLATRLEASAFVRALGGHVSACATCRDAIPSAVLMAIGDQTLRTLGRPPHYPPPTEECLQVEFVAKMFGGNVNHITFARNYATHILSCHRCARLVPNLISPELLLAAEEPAAVPA